MRKLMLLFCLLHSLLINAQVINWDKFNEETMSSVMFSQSNEYTKHEFKYSIVRSSAGQGKIYKCLRKNCEKLSLDDLNEKIHKSVLRKLDSKFITKSNLIGNIALLDSIPAYNVHTYQEIAGKCITDWLNSVEGVIYMRWSKIGEAISYYNISNKTVYIVFVYILSP